MLTCYPTAIMASCILLAGVTFATFFSVHGLSIDAPKDHLIPWGYEDSSTWVIGGGPSERGRWPWMLSLQRLRDSGSYSHSCGAALLTPKWILTAAHCLTSSKDPKNYRVLVGSFNQTAGDEEDMIYLRKFIIHEKYDARNPPGIPFDVAVAELEREVTLGSKFVGLAQLPRHGDRFDGNPNCWVTGWGRYDSNPENWEVSPYLKELNTKVWSREQCQFMWNVFSPGMGSNIFEEHVCVAGPDDGVCHGDSGGPLNCDMTGEGDWVVAGVASWASGSSCIGATGVYASIEYYLDWVQDKVPGLPGAKP